MMDIFGALKPTLHVSRLVGLGPFVVDEESKVLKPSSIATAYTIGLTLAFVGNAVHSLYVKLKTKNSAYLYISQQMDVVFLASGSLQAVCVLIMTVVQKKRIVSTVHCFHDVDTEMAKLGIRFPYERAFRCSWAVIACIAVLVAFLIGYDIFNWYQDELHFIFTFIVTSFFPIAYSAVMELQFISGTILLKKHFAFLNSRLTRLKAERASRDEGVAKIDGGCPRRVEPCPVPGSEQPISAWIGANASAFKMRKVTFFDGKVAALRDTSLADIKTIRRVHGKLCDIQDDLNTIFSVQLLVTVARAFVIIISNLYLLFTLSLKQMEKSYWMSYPILGAFCHAAELVCIVVACTSACKTANHSAIIVHKLLTKNWETNIRNQLKLFSIQLLHRKISFTACGFFTLDMSLLHAIIGAATTYLVILIQFHDS